ncbi:MAG: helix-turn-helix transcriptional regulator [Phycisphaeraceae bacterium]|nr:helix-turn-helix transcriptional regulator [Phycisphaeraceae bacterium]
MPLKANPDMQKSLSECSTLFRVRLRMLLSRRRMSGLEFMRRTGLSQSSYYGYVSGKILPSYASMILMCHELGVSSDYLLGIAEDGA